MPKQKKVTPKATLIRDTREKPGHGWFWEPNDWCEGTVIQTLKTGDYTIAGLENQILIDRKGGIAEFVGNLTQDRFKRELERFKEVHYGVVLLEFSKEDLVNWPEGAGLSPYQQSLTRLTGRGVVKLFEDMQLIYSHVHFIFAEGNGQYIATKILKRAAALWL